MFKNYYKILGISPSVNISEIKKAYRKLALRYHPDKNKAPNAQQKFVEITEAYEVLKDETQRKIYDQIFNRQFTTNQTSNNNSREKQTQWSEFGKRKAGEYSEMEFDLFTKRVFGEIKVVAKNSLSIGLILFCIFGVIAGFAIMSLSPLIGVFTILLWGSLGYLLFNRTKENYRKDRNKIF